MAGIGARPFGVTLAGIFIMIGGIANLINAVRMLFGMGDEGFTRSIFLALIAGVIGLIYLALAKGVFDGNKGPRLIVAIISVISIFTGIFIFFEGGFSQILVGLIVLILLYSAKSKVFFG